MLDQWTAVDGYITDALLPDDPALDAALEASAAAGLPAINVSPAQGKFLMLLARIQGARSILEIGTLGGYSAIWMARALPAGGRLVSLEINPAYAALARTNVARAGLASVVDIRLGRAIESLPKLAAEGGAPFDLVFIDADKALTPEYFELALAMTAPGAVIIADNSVRGGAVADPATADQGAQGMRRFHELAAAEPRVTGTTIQTVGAKGHDGFTLMLVGPPRRDA